LYFSIIQSVFTVFVVNGPPPVHHTPTAWDRTFRGRSAAYVIVHLNDGSEVAGAWIENSFASSAANDRDIFIAQMWKNELGGWKAVEPTRSILICGELSE
jgi:hypothetical protein